MLRLEVWPGGKVELDKMKVPLNAEVKSGGEIEKYGGALEGGFSGRAAARAGSHSSPFCSFPCSIPASRLGLAGEDWICRLTRAAGFAGLAMSFVSHFFHVGEK